MNIITPRVIGALVHCLYNYMTLVSLLCVRMYVKRLSVWKDEFTKQHDQKSFSFVASANN